MERGKFRVIGSTHIDLAWKKDREEMAELFEAFAVRLLDLLDHHPTFTYVLEQAAHLRQLASRRPDLVRRLRSHVRAGRLEVVGGMASTMETNIPNGECFVRNQLLGLGWFQQNFGTRPTAGWLIDTFGIHAQCPQLLRQVGMSFLFANRFGGTVDVTTFRARGLDGTELPVIGRDVYAPYVRPGPLHFRFVQSWRQIDALFEEAARAAVRGPVLVMPYTENETLPSLAVMRCVERMNARKGAGTWELALPSQLCPEVRGASPQWAVLDGDLNPEFTGTYSQRSIIRRRNRSVETQLLDAEKWLCLLGAPAWHQDFEECWWKLAFIHFHDVFTGSHPTLVRDQVLAGFDEIESTVALHRDRLLGNRCRTVASAQGYSLFAFNSLPWPRAEVLRVGLPDGVGSIQRLFSLDGDVPFEQVGRELRLRADLPSLGQRTFQLQADAGASADADEIAPLEAASVRIGSGRYSVSCDTVSGVSGIALKGAAGDALVGTGLLLVAQQDDGSFQIESPQGSEIPASSGSQRLLIHTPSPLGQRVTLAGTFPELPWSPGSSLAWEEELFVPEGMARIDLRIKIRWKGERTRIRLKVQTRVEASSCIQEVPFGTVRRKPYRERGTARGEWPVQRFAALEDGRIGLALINRGTVGVEAAGGTIWTTLLRAPASEYAGMIPDDTSSQHGEHEFLFSVVPYAGSWHEASIHRIAAEVNSPPLVLLRQGRPARQPLPSQLRLEAATVMLSAVKAAADGSRDLIVRLYETAGIADRANLTVVAMEAAWESTLEESIGAVLDRAGHKVALDLKPFEIRTIRIRRKGEESSGAKGSVRPVRAPGSEAVTKKRSRRRR